MKQVGSIPWHGKGQEHFQGHENRFTEQISHICSGAKDISE